MKLRSRHFRQCSNAGELKEVRNFSLPDSQAVVLDSGSGYIKAGIANAWTPQVIEPQVVGRPKLRKAFSGDAVPAFYGKHARCMSAVCKLRSPSERGLITSFQDQELIWYNMFTHQLKVDTQAQPVLLSEIPLSSRHQRERLGQLLFEDLGVPGLAVKPDSVLALYGVGRTRGLVIDCGDSVSHTSAVYEGCVAFHSEERLQLGGRDVTEYLGRLMRKEAGFCSETHSEFDHIRRIKEASGCVGKASSSESSSPRHDPSTVTYVLPDGQEISMCEDGYNCGEILFEPELVGKDAKGISEMAYTSIMHCPEDIREELFRSVIVTGGSSLLRGFKDRVRADLTSMAGPMYPWVDVFADGGAQCGVWRGGLVVANLSTFTNMCVNKEEYFEHGSRIINMKCC